MTKPPKDWDIWIRNWEDTIKLADEQQIPDALIARAWSRDFLASIRNVSPVIEIKASIFEETHREQIQNNILTYGELANWFRQLMMTPAFPKTRRIQVAKGGFAVTTGTEDPEPIDEEPPKETQPKKRRRAVTTTTRADKCLVCEMAGHQL